VSDGCAGSDDGGALDSSAQAFTDNHQYVLGVLRRSGVRPRDSQDLAQDVFLVMHRRWSEYRSELPIRPWLAGIAQRVARRHLGRIWRETPADDLDPQDQTSLPDERLQEKRARVTVLRALAELRPADRDLIVACELEGRSMRAVAASMAVPLYTAYTRLRRARLRFARALSEVDRPPSRRRLAFFLSVAIGLAVVCLRAEAPARGRAPAGLWRFDESAGSIASDGSGRGRDCLLRELDPQRAWTRGKLGGAIDVRHGWLECPQPAVAATSRTALSVALWVRVLDRSTGHAALVARQLGAGRQDYFFLGTLGARLKVRSTLWRTSVMAAGPLPRDRWVHVAFTHDASGTTRLYQDGMEVARGRGSGHREALVTTPITMGAGIDGPAEPGEPFRGVVDEVATWDRALTSGEIAALAGASGKIAALADARAD
jgi:RNA polymerase sigma-70 factor (ECF subfamily)